MTLLRDAHEIQSGRTRLCAAAGLIKQLPYGHEGRNTWLMNYSSSPEADTMRAEHPLKPRWTPLTESAETSGDKIPITCISQISEVAGLKMSIRFDNKIKKFAGREYHPAAYLINQPAKLLLAMIALSKPYVNKEDYFTKLATSKI